MFYLKKRKKRMKGYLGNKKQYFFLLKVSGLSFFFIRRTNNKRGITFNAEKLFLKKIVFN